MAHGPDTDELLRRLEKSRSSHKLDVSRLHITSLPELPAELQWLWCYDTPLTALPELPAGLQILWCSNTQITSLPELPGGLQELYCYRTLLTSLPGLPGGLKGLWCYNTPLTVLPELPVRLQVLWCSNTLLATLPELPARLLHIVCDNTPLLLQKGKDESIDEYIARWRKWHEEHATMKRAKERCAALKEELAAAAWAPQRVERWLDAGIELEAL